MPIYVGTQKIDVSGMDKVYVGTQLVYQKAIPVVLTSISISGQKTSFNRYDSFAFNGTVTAHYDNGTTANVTSQSTFSGYNMNNVGQQTVTVSYTENDVTKTTTYKITVNKRWTTLFSGSKSITWNHNSGTAPSSVNIYSNTSNWSSLVSSMKQVRITFSFSGSITSTSYGSGYVVNSTKSSPRTTTSKPGSPQTLTLTSSTGTMYYIGCISNSSGAGSSLTHGLYLQYRNRSDNQFRLMGTTDTYVSAASSGSMGITVTKIEYTTD